MKRAVVVIALALSACKPWTVRPIDDNASAARGGTGAAAAPGAAGTAGAARFEPAAYVEGIWSTKVLPQAASEAIDLAGALAATPSSSSSSSSPSDNAGPRAVLVRGVGIVIKVDRQSRVGLAYVDLDPVDGRPDAALQIGPVLRGTSLRDAVGFIRFADFANQIDYARVGNALNDRVLSTVLKDVAGDAADALKGRRVAFTGAVRMDSRTPVEVVPITLRVEGAAQ
jgi:predicted lipoprotein